jgi:integration host factor subunit alpha
MAPKRKQNNAFLQKTLTRAGLARAVYDRHQGLPLPEARRLVDSAIEEIIAAVTSGETLKLHKFGSFFVREKRGRVGRNPRTGAPATVESRKVVLFKASPCIKTAANGSPRL